MKVLAYVEIVGDFEEMTDDEVEEFVEKVIEDGAEVNCCNSKVDVLQVLDNQ